MNIKTQLKKNKYIQAIRINRKAIKEAKVAFSDRRLPPILIYQMGKVGSRSVYKSLEMLSLPNFLLHLHFLSDDLPIHINIHKTANVYPLPYHIYLGQAVNKILKSKANFPCKIITLFRDPIGYYISNLFEAPFYAISSMINTNDASSIKKICDIINNKLCQAGAFDYVYNWFDKELKSVFGIDVLNLGFPKEKGYATYSNNNTEVLVMRLEDLSSIWKVAIRGFLGVEADVKLLKANITTGKQGCDIYQDLKKNIKIDRRICESVYTSNFVKHFYNEKMINDFYLKWT
jgi:hypothetical protein